MKRYEVYRNIRKRATIMGLPVSLFALLMVSVVGSLLIMIFSFRFSVIVILLLFNALFFWALGRWDRNPYIFKKTKVFPDTISNKKIGLGSYGED